MAKLPSAEEYCHQFCRMFGTSSHCESCDSIRAYGKAVLEAAAELPTPPARLPGTENPRGLVIIGYNQAWKDYQAAIRALKEID